MDPTEHRLRPESWWLRRLVESAARGRATRRHSVEAVSDRTGRDRGRVQRLPDRTVAKPSGGLCCLSAARADRRASGASYRGDQPGSSWSLGSGGAAWTQSTLRLGGGPGDHRGDGRRWLFSVLLTAIPRLCFTRASLGFGPIHPPGGVNTLRSPVAPTR